eukprot:Skav204487  [mRNA]  locus=scaffold535:124344:127498:+ [translate_table: standard]
MVEKPVLDVAAAETDPETGSKLETLVKGSDLVISLLPATMHVPIAKHAIQHGVSMVTASYAPWPRGEVSPEMNKLHQEAEKAKVLILNEAGRALVRQLLAK